MSSDLVLPEDFKTKVSNRVRDIFMDLIPDDTLNEMVAKEIKAFFENADQTYRVREGTGYGAVKQFETMCSPFRLMVWNEVRTLVEPKLQTIFNSEEWKTETIWNSDTHMTEVQISELLDAKLEKVATLMAKNMFQNMFSQAVVAVKADLTNDVRQTLQTMGINGY